MKNSVQKITEQAKTRDTQGRFKVALADISDAAAIDLVTLLSKVQLNYSQDNKDKTTQIILFQRGRETVVLDFRLKVIKPLGAYDKWDSVIATDQAVTELRQQEKKSGCKYPKKGVTVDDK